MLEAKRKALDPTPPRPAYAELNIPIRLANGQTVALYDAASEAFEDKSHDCPSDPAITAEELALEFQNTVIEEPGLTDRSPDQISGQETNSFSSSKPPSSGSSSSPTSSPAYPTPSKPFSKTLPEQPLDPQIIEANDWAMNYINTRIANGVVSTSRASKAELRAYYLWDHQYLEPHEIAALLRDPPLETSTVSGYIFRAIRAEHLRFDLTRARRLIPLVHVSSRWRYEAMVSNRTKKGEEATNAQDRPGIQSTSGGEDNGRTS